MRHARPGLFAAVLFSLALAGCAPETAAPGVEREQEPVGGLTPLGAPTESELRADLTRLGNYVLPNDQSIVSKFDALVTAYQAGTGFADELQALIDKINLEVQKYTRTPTNGSLNDCVDGGTYPGCETVGMLRDQVIADIYRFVGLDPDATICIVPPGAPSTFCETQAANDNAGFVYFPPALFSQLTYVSIKALQNSSVFSGLDEYGYVLEIRTAPVTTFGNDQPIVVACVPTDTPADVLDRLLLAHRRAEAKYGPNPPFSLLPDEDLSGDQTLESYAAQFCGVPQPSAGPTGPSLFGLSADSPLNRMLVSARDLLLPEPLHASNALLLATRGFSGASGSPEEFSTFRAVDRGVTGAGGSAEEFAPSATGAATAAATGEAGSSSSTGLPTVVVQTPAGGAGVPGVRVTFALADPTSTDGSGNLLYTPASEASLCIGSPTTVVTDANGAATLPCLNFGTKAGYKNLQVSFDPGQVFTDLAISEQPCMIGAAGTCDNTFTQNFLIETVAGPAAGIAIVEGNNQVAAAYTAVATAPKVVVTDQYGNVVAGADVDWSANVGTIEPNNGLGNEDNGSTTTGTDGTTALTSWTLGVGANTLLAELTTAGGIQSVTFNATGTFELVLANACVTGGAKDDITRFGFYVPNEKNKIIQAIGLNLSSNGAPGQSENYEVTLTATRRLQQGSSVETQVRQATARLQSGSNSSKGEESLVIFDFGSNPFMGDNRNGDITVRMSVVEVINGIESPLPSNRSVNMNAGGCSAGSKNCKPVAVTGARACNITESQLNPLVLDYRRGLAARIYTSP